MNRVILMGRLTRDPDVRYSQGGEGSMAVATEDVQEVMNPVMSRQQILSAVLHSLVQQNSLRSIFIRELRLL